CPTPPSVFLFSTLLAPPQRNMPTPFLKLSSRPEQRRLMPLRSGGIAAPSPDLARLPLPPFFFPLFSCVPLCPPRRKTEYRRLRFLCGPSANSAVRLSLFRSSQRLCVPGVHPNLVGCYRPYFLSFLFCELCVLCELCVILFLPPDR